MYQTRRKYQESIRLYKGLTIYANRSAHVLFSGFISCKSEIRCPNTWVRYDDSCYLFSNNDAVHFTEAEHYCQHLGGHLVTIESSLENAFHRDHIGSLKHENYWIGLTDQLVEGVFRWNITGPIPTFFDWGRADQPNDENHNQDCVEFYHWDTGIHWNDQGCTHNDFPLCEKNFTSLMLNYEVVVG